MKLGVLLLQALLDDVTVDLSFAPVVADRTDGAPIRPACHAPAILLDRGPPADELPGSVALEYPDQSLGLRAPPDAAVALRAVIGPAERFSWTGWNKLVKL